MNASVRINSTFRLRSRNVFVLACEILDGTVRIGMVVELPRDGERPVGLRVSGVEFVDYGERRADIGLCVPCEDEEQARQFESLGLVGRVVDVVEAGAG